MDAADGGGAERSGSQTLTDEAALAAMANPFRTRMLDALVVDGPSTASSLAKRTGQAVGSASHHLKVLAGAGLIEEAPELARDRRERWWRLVAPSTRWSRAEFAHDAGAVTAAMAAEAVGLQRQFERARDWLANAESAGEWDDAAFATQTWVSVSPDELRELADELNAVLRRWRERQLPDDSTPRESAFVFRSRLSGTAVTAGRRLSLLWLGEGVSVLGNATTSVLLPLLAVTGLGAGPGVMGLITASAWLPWLLLGLPAGAWVDGLPPRAVMIAADLVAAVVLLSVPVAVWVGSLHVAQLVVVAFGEGVATVFFRTAYAKLVPSLVPEDTLESANARLVGTESAMQVAGPGVAGVLASAFSAAAGLMLDVVSFVVSAVCLWRIGASPRARVTQPARNLRDRVREGVRLVRGDRYLRTFTIIGGISNFGLTGYGALMVLFLVNGLRLPSAAVGAVLALGSVGGVIGAAIATPLVRRLGSGRASTVLLLVAGPSALLVGLPTRRSQLALTVAGLIVVGAGVVAGNVVRGAWRQRYVPADLLGRVISTSQIVNYGTMPLAGLTAALLGGELGVRPTILLMAATHAAASCSVLLTPLARERHLPPPVERAVSVST